MTDTPTGYTRYKSCVTPNGVWIDVLVDGDVARLTVEHAGRGRFPCLLSAEDALKLAEQIRSKLAPATEYRSAFSPKTTRLTFDNSVSDVILATIQDGEDQASCALSRQDVSELANQLNAWLGASPGMDFQIFGQSLNRILKTEIDSAMDVLRRHLVDSVGASREGPRGLLDSAKQAQPAEQRAMVIDSQTETIREQRKQLIALEHERNQLRAECDEQRAVLDGLVVALGYKQA